MLLHPATFKYYSLAMSFFVMTRIAFCLLKAKWGWNTWVCLADGSLFISLLRKISVVALLYQQHVVEWSTWSSCFTQLERCTLSGGISWPNSFSPSWRVWTSDPLGLKLDWSITATKLTWDSHSTLITLHRFISCHCFHLTHLQIEVACNQIKLENWMPKDAFRQRLLIWHPCGKRK